MNELKEYSVAILTNVAENPGNTRDSNGIWEQIENSIIGNANNNLIEDIKQINESPQVDSSEKTTTNNPDASTSISIQNIRFVCSKPALRYFSYRGQVCSSCRSFFYRAVKSKNSSLFTCKKTKTY